MTRRLVAYMVLAALVSSALTVGVAALLSNRAQVNDRIDALETRAGDVAANLEARGAVQQKRLRIYTVGARGGFTQLRNAPRVRAALTAKADGSGQLHVGKRDLIYVKRDTTAGPIALIRQRGKLPGDAGPVGGTLVIAGLGGALVAALLAAVLARRFLQPVKELTTATVALAAGQDVRVATDGEDELAELAASFNRMADDLGEARDAERRFVHAVSHELRTPLTAIAGYAEGLEDGTLTTAEVAPVLKAETARLERLVHDLLELAAIGRSDFAVRREAVDLQAVAAAIEDRFAHRAADKQVSLVVTGAGSVAGDTDRLIQAVANLVDNALRVTPAGGTVSVTAGAERIAVEDTGPGLESSAAGGLGLGLAIVRTLVEAMGGTARAEPGSACGARFVLTLLPVRPA